MDQITHQQFYVSQLTVGYQRSDQSVLPLKKERDELLMLNPAVNQQFELAFQKHCQILKEQTNAYIPKMDIYGAILLDPTISKATYMYTRLKIGIYYFDTYRPHTLFFHSKQQNLYCQIKPTQNGIVLQTCNWNNRPTFDWDKRFPNFLKKYATMDFSYTEPYPLEYLYELFLTSDWTPLLEEKHCILNKSYQFQKKKKSR